MDLCEQYSDFVWPRVNEAILDQVNSPEFTVYSCIQLLCENPGNIGIHHFLCQRLIKFPHSELQFYIPQLVQVLLTIETESMALEDLLMNLKNENPHFALLTFWQLQALLSDLSLDPDSYGFQVARRLLNKLQRSLFSSSYQEEEHAANHTKLNENIAPALVFSSMVFASMALPRLSEVTKPLVESQGKRQKAYVFRLARSAMKDFTKNITLKNTLINKKSNRKHNSALKNNNNSDSNVDIIDPTRTKEDVMFKKTKKNERILGFDIVDNVGEKVFEERILNSIKMPKRRSKFLDGYESTPITENNSAENLTQVSKAQVVIDQRDDHHTHATKSLISQDRFSNSMPDLHNSKMRMSTGSLPPTQRTSSAARTTSQPPYRWSKNGKSRSVASTTQQDEDISQLSTQEKIKRLKSNYFRCTTQFAIALEVISQRLSQVPTEARLSALRAELSLLNRDLPAEVDIPTLLPPSKKGKLHKLVHITANEAQVLNSAEKVPYLLLIEYLRDELDFDPNSESNVKLLKQGTESNNLIFDLNYMGKHYNKDDIFNYPPSPILSSRHASFDDGILTGDVVREDSLSSPSIQHSFFEGNDEEDLGDMSMIKVKNQTDAQAYRNKLIVKSVAKVPRIPGDTQLRNPELTFTRNLDEAAADSEVHSSERRSKADDLADQMRVSAVMLAQLDQSPLQLAASTNQIRAQIIASMKEVQDKFGYRDLENIHGMAGERKLENDLMTGGIETSYLGEDWATKKERIRKTSVFGHLENWDLCSVIAKSGDDLRQEAFACQMIQAMAQIWQKEKVDVWVKKMKILITSANTGLVETITNAISVHSIKKALTTKMIEDGELDDKGHIASLLDHYIRTFGDPEKFKFKRAQDNFASSLAAYSVICYLLQIKDRHNGNIMIDNEGHLTHIDFGFMLSNSPGSVKFEGAPFKLTYEYIELMGGLESAVYKKFVRLVKEAFKAVRKYADQLVSMCEIMQKDNMQPCFNAGDQTSVQLRQRFQLEINDDEIDDYVDAYLINKSIGSIYTRLYDQFQLITQGIYS